MRWRAKLKGPAPSRSRVTSNAAIESVDSPRCEETRTQNLDHNWCLRNDVCVGASGPCSVVVRRRSGPRPPLRFAWLDRVRGAVPGIRRFVGGKSGLPQPPVAFAQVLTRLWERSLFRMGALA
jgi:hypothetical protein